VGNKKESTKERRTKVSQMGTTEQTFPIKTINQRLEEHGVMTAKRLLA
jgi:hypothetical protein